RYPVDFLALVAVDHGKPWIGAARHVDAMPRRREHDSPWMILEPYKCRLTASYRVQQGHPGIRRDGEEIPPTSGGHVAADGDVAAGGRLVGGRSDHLGGIDRHQPLVRGPEQLDGHAAQRLRPGEAHATRERHDPPFPVYGV